MGHPARYGLGGQLRRHAYGSRWTLLGLAITAREDLDDFTPGSGALFVGAGKRLSVTISGYIVETASGSYMVGRCLDAAVSSGSVGTDAFNFATIVYMGNSGEFA